MKEPPDESLEHFMQELSKALIPEENLLRIAEENYEGTLTVISGKQQVKSFLWLLEN